MESEFEGIKKLRRGTLILILVPLLVGFIALLLISSSFSALASGSFSLTLSTIGALVAVVIIGAILGIIRIT